MADPVAVAVADLFPVSAALEAEVGALPVVLRGHPVGSAAAAAARITAAVLAQEAVTVALEAAVAVALLGGLPVLAAKVLQ